MAFLDYLIAPFKKIFRKKQVKKLKRSKKPPFLRRKKKKKSIKKRLKGQKRPTKRKSRIKKTVKAKSSISLKRKRKKLLNKTKFLRQIKSKSKIQKPMRRASDKNIKKPSALLVGEITHFFSKIQVCVVKIIKEVKVGDLIHIKGNTTDFTQVVKSLQIESVDVKLAKKGDLVGLKVVHKAKVGDKVYKN